MKRGILLFVLSALLVPAAASADPDCTSAYGTTACGYSCVAAYGEIKCAQTPAGVCTAAYGEVTCWDPPRLGRRHRHRRGPQAECKSAYGTTACGYSCVAAYGEVRCADRPDAVCSAAYGSITCSGDQ
jgi:hypothetical protein